MKPKRYLCLSLLYCLMLICLPINADTESSERKSIMTTSAMLEETVNRLSSLKAQKGELTLWLQTGAGEEVSAVAQTLSQRLEQQQGFVFSQMKTIQQVPVADINVPGQHVHAANYQFNPYPDLVISISEVQGQIYICTREAGADPLAGGCLDWLWVLPEQ